MDGNTKFCQHCGQIIAKDAVICPQCGRQVEQLATAQPVIPNIIINNTNTNTNTNNNRNVNSNVNGNIYIKAANARSKWVALLLCFFLGFIGAHKFYEGKTVMGVLYLFTGGLLGIGVFIDFLALLFKPNPYYV